MFDQYPISFWIIWLSCITILGFVIYFIIKALFSFSENISENNLHSFMLLYIIFRL